MVLMGPPEPASSLTSTALIWVYFKPLSGQSTEPFVPGYFFKIKGNRLHQFSVSSLLTTPLLTGSQPHTVEVRGKP